MDLFYKGDNMEKLRGCCGFNCYMCAAYEPNIKNKVDQEKVAEKWKKYFDYDIDPEAIKCKGCFESDEFKEFMLHPECEYRDCVKDKDISACKECNGFPCEKLIGYINAYKEVYKNVADKVAPEDIDGYFFTYTTALDIK